MLCHFHWMGVFGDLALRGVSCSNSITSRFFIFIRTNDWGVRTITKAYHSEATLMAIRTETSAS